MYICNVQFTQFFNNTKVAFNPDYIISLAVQSMNNADIVDYNISQLMRGERYDGVILGEYSPLTIQIKQELGGFISPSGNIALIDTFKSIAKVSLILII